MSPLEEAGEMAVGSDVCQDFEGRNGVLLPSLPFGPSHSVLLTGEGVTI